jgi:hypothetical protein
VVQVGLAQAEVEVEPLVLPAGANAEVGREPTAMADTGAAVAVRVGRWSCGGTPPSTSEEHYRMELP